jgi:hypothetical protein
MERLAGKGGMMMMSRRSRSDRRGGVAAGLGIAVMVAGSALGAVVAVVAPAPVPVASGALADDNCPPYSCGSNHNQVLL